MNTCPPKRKKKRKAERGGLCFSCLPIVCLHKSRAAAAMGVCRAASAADAIEDLAACSFQRKRLWYLLQEENNPWLWRMSSREITWMPLNFTGRLSF